MNKDKIIYNPNIFNTSNEQEAKNIILTKEDGLETNNRWNVETQFLKKDIESFFKNKITNKSIILDYGCGIGTLSKELIQTFNCKVIGVDISSSMREKALKYVNNKLFQTISPKELKEKVIDGFKFDAAISIWVLQHSITPIEDISLIKSSLKKDSLFYVLNNNKSAIPTNKGWVDNGINIKDILEKKFNVIEVNKLPEEVSSEKIKQLTFIAKLKNNRNNNYLQEQYRLGIENFNKNIEKVENIQKELLEKYPYEFESYHLKGLISFKKHQFQKTYNLFIKALSLNILNPTIYHNLSNLLEGAKKIDEAILFEYQAIRTSNRKDSFFFFHLGLLFENKQQYKIAIESYNSALSLDPKNANIINNMAILFYNIKKYNESLNLFKLAAKTNPKLKSIYSNIGACLNKLKKYDEALINLNKAIELEPLNSGAYTNRGNVFYKLYKYKEAIKDHKKAIKLDPKGYNAYSNLANALKSEGKITLAIKNYEKAIELNPNFVNAHFDLATSNLMIENFKKGFEEYEWRFKKDEIKSHLIKYKSIYELPLLHKNLKKKDIKNKLVLIHSEQGFGDNIQFSRYIMKLKNDFNCKIIVTTRKELVRLFKDSFGNNDIDIYDRELFNINEFNVDYQISILSLAYFLNVEIREEIISTNKYLITKEDNLNINIPNDKKINIGICWSASITGESYDGKVFDLKYLEPLINNKNINLFSLQIGPEAEDIKKYNFQDKIIDVSDKIKDFKDTALLMNKLDFVISSDTSVAHLAGALGKKVYIPLQKIPDWRWLKNGSKSFWYDSAILFRQKTARNWDNVFDSLITKIINEYKLK